MKEISQLVLPEDVKYATDHEWARVEGDEVVIGLADYAQDQLGDIVFVELPGEGDTFDKGDEFGTVESVKAVSELYMPLGGEIVAVNEALEDSPELLNQDPYGGWIIEIKPSDPARAFGRDDTDATELTLSYRFGPRGPLGINAAYLNLLEGERVYALDSERLYLMPLTSRQTDSYRLGAAWRLNKELRLAVMVGRNRRHELASTPLQS